MEAITEYIKRNSNGRKRPVRGATIASAFGVSGVRVRNIASDKSELEDTIASIKGRISVMNNAVDGLEQYLTQMG